MSYQRKGDDLERAVARSDWAKGGRPAHDHVLMFKILVLQAAHTLSDERCEYLIRDRLSFMRFLGLSLTSRGPDANSIWNFREALTRAVIDGKPAIEVLFGRFDTALSEAGFIAMGGHIIDATIVAAPITAPKTPPFFDASPSTPLRKAGPGIPVSRTRKRAGWSDAFARSVIGQMRTRAAAVS